MGLVTDQGRQVLLSGQVAWDDKRHVVGIGDMRRQAQQTFRNIHAFIAGRVPRLP